MYRENIKNEIVRNMVNMNGILEDLLNMLNRNMLHQFCYKECFSETELN